MVEAADRLEEAFNLALSDLHEANAAVQICWRFHNKDQSLNAEPEERLEVWKFLEQGICWKLALALARLTQPGHRDRASLDGLIREINAARLDGMALADEGQVRQAEVALATARAEDICNALRNSRNAFIGHTLIGECRQGVPVLDLIEYVGTLESIAESLYDGVYGRRPDFDTHIGTWLDISTAWFEHMLPDRNE